jgi:heme exporter protein C
MWGTYWVWDARLTSMLLLFFLYLGHIALSRAYDDPERGDRAAGDPGAGRRDQPAGDQVLGRLVEHAAPARLGDEARRARRSIPAILTPLMVMAAALLLLFVVLVLLRTETEIDRRRLEAAELAG